MNLFSCCFQQPSLSLESFSLIDKALGNIKNSHKSLTFVGLLEHIKDKVSLVHYQFEATGSQGSVGVISKGHNG